MTEPPASRFLTAVTYWPAYAGPFWWSDFQFDQVTRDLDAARMLGVARAHLVLPWSDFQPERHRIAAVMMHRLELVLNGFSDLGMSAVITLLPVAYRGARWLPSWALDPFGAARTPIVSGGTSVLRAARALYDDRAMLQAQALQVREVTNEFDAHPATEGWVLGSGLDTVSKPSGLAGFTAWLEAITQAAGRALRPGRVWHSVSSDALISAQWLSGEAAGALGLGVAVSTQAPPSWGVGGTLEWESFLAGYARAVTGLPALINMEHATTVSGGARPYMTDHVRAAWRAGAGGVLGPSLMGQVNDAVRAEYRLTGQVPEDRALLNADRAPTDSAFEWFDATSGSLDVRDPERAVLSIDPEVRVHDPVGSARMAFEEFVR